MKGNKKTVLGCTASVIALSMLSTMAVMAEGDSDSIANSVWTYRAVADVSTQVNIRAEASTESAIIGYLPKAGSADVIERGEEWSHIISNGVEGYIMNEYLAYGQDAKKLAEVYGYSGVQASWDGVNVFSAPDAAAKVLTTADEGESYQIISDQGDWIYIQLDDDTTAYIPAEDVEETILLERAIPVDTTPQTVDVSSYEESTQTQTNTDSYDTTESTESGVAAETSQTETYEQVQETEAYVPETEAVTETEAVVPETEAAVTETEAVVTETEAPAVETEAPAAETEAPAAETAATEAAAESSEETVTNASTDDLSLLAALIYCEAGNQSREGKVAVGAVVLHRVASGSFASTISGVIYQSGQFSPASSGALAGVLASGVPSDCYEAAQAALNGEDPVPGALYFNTGSGSGVKIGAHQFF